jgi:hypothetical protein
MRARVEGSFLVSAFLAASRAKPRRDSPRSFWSFSYSARVRSAWTKFLAEWGGVDFFSFGFQFLNFGEFVASDHFEKEAVIGSETGVEVGEVGFVGDVDSTEESDFDSVFFVKGEGGLEEDVFTGAIDADEVGGLFFGGKSFLGGGQEGEGGEGCEEEFHELRVS